jgi:lactate 2-monooxygenase
MSALATRLQPSNAPAIRIGGALAPEPPEGMGVARQAEVFTRGLGGKRPNIPLHPDDLEALASRYMTKEAFDYIAGGAGIEQTMASNRAAFERWSVRRRVLRDVSQPDMSIELFGQKMVSPILVAPMGAMRIAHAEADLGIASGARERGVGVVISSQGCKRMEETAVALGDAPRWFQLYWGKSDEVMQSFVNRAKKIGSSAIVVTVDNELFGWRARDIQNAYVPMERGLAIDQYASDPAFQKLMKESKRGKSPEVPMNLHTAFAYLQMQKNYPGGFLHNLLTGDARRGIETFVENFSRPSLSWDDLEKLRRATDEVGLPFLVKGIMTPEDALRAIASGAQGIIVSNHGGRQIDGELAALDALPAIVKAVGGRVPILFDSGIRTGSDAFKALALGAKAVLVGRPCAFGLAIDGGRGVSEVLYNIQAELDLTMRLAGCARTSEIDETMLTRSIPRQG